MALRYAPVQMVGKRYLRGAYQLARKAKVIVRWVGSIMRFYT